MIQNILLAVLFGGVFTLCFGGIGVFLISRLRAAKREAAESLDWPSTPGQIIISNISMYQPSREVDSSRSPTYAPMIEYTYTVQGIEYHGNRIGFTGGGEISGTRGDAARLIKPYPVNASVPVFFDPNNPAEAVLEHKVQRQGGMLVVTIVFLLLGVTACGISIATIINILMK